MINLGPYSGKTCPNVHFQPTIADRTLEGLAFLILLATWSSIYWLYTREGGFLSRDAWIMGGSAILSSVIVGFCAYAPVRLINFPVRVSERNIAVQYLLAVRIVRVMNVILNLTFLSGVFLHYYKWAFVLFGASFALLAVVLIGYYILAFKYK